MKHNRVLDCVNDGQTIMTDKGFDIIDYLATYQAQTGKTISLLIPPFKTKSKPPKSTTGTKGQQHDRNTKDFIFTKSDITFSRLVAHHRIIIENSIGWLKKWKILNGNVRFELFPIFNKVIKVVCFLTNLKHYISIHTNIYSK